MQRITRISTATVVALLLIAGNAPSLPIKKKAKVPVSVAVCPTTFATCPDEGCGTNKDDELNRAKNKSAVPAESDVQDMTITQIRSLAQPTRWNTNDDRSPIQGDEKEGTPVRVMGRLKLIKNEGAESCNCGITGLKKTDLHLVIVSRITDPEATSMTAEMTPRVRANGHPNWLRAKMIAAGLQGKFIRLTGYLMLDTKHIRQTHLLLGERRNSSLVRATNWEVHPITKFEVCKSTIANCRTGTGWQEF